MLKQPEQDIKMTPYSIKDLKLGLWILSATFSKTLASYGPPEDTGTAKGFYLWKVSLI